MHQNKIRPLFLVFALLLLSVGAVSAQVPELIKNPEFRRDAQAAVDSIYNFNAAGADKRLAKWKKQYPHHPIWKLMDGMEMWWTLLSDLHDTSRDKAFYKQMKQADYAASKLAYNHPGHADALIIETVANGYVARLHSDREEWVSGLNTARKAYSAFGYLQEQMPDLADLKMGEGLKLYYSAYLPEEYPVVKTVSWFLPDGDKKKGLRNLRQAADSAVFARAEATYFLGNINLNYEHHYHKAAPYFKKLYERYPRNNYYARLLVKSYYKMGRYDDALRVINASLKRWEENSIPFKKVLQEELYFWKGRILYRRNDDAKALALFKKSLQCSKKLPRSRHRNYYPAAAYYAGLILSRRQERQAAKHYFKTALKAKTGDQYKELAKEKMADLR